MKPDQRSKQTLQMLGIGVIVVAAVALLGLSITNFVMLQKQSKEAKEQSQTLENRVAELEKAGSFAEEQVDKDRYQAVFLVNGQVYFGNITKITKDSLKLERIYYLSEGTMDEAGNVTSSSVKLVKLGDELHSPDDVMMIERKNVTFWENLKSDGEVAKAIDEYKKSH